MTLKSLTKKIKNNYSYIDKLFLKNYLNFDSLYFLNLLYYNITKNQKQNE